MEEFYQQGDIEKKLGYEISPYFDRTKCNPFVFQQGYIQVVVEPLLTTWCEFLGQTVINTVINKGLEENTKLIKQKISETSDLGNHDLNSGHADGSHSDGGDTE